MEMYIAAGLTAGVMAGLFGIGGGLVMVPVLIAVLARELAPELVMPFALGTSLAAIVFSASSSAWGHFKKDAIDLVVVRRVLPALALGAVMGACFATFLPRSALVSFLAIFQIALCLYMVRKTFFALVPIHQAVNSREPSLPLLGVIGVTCALTGIGGGTLSVPYFRFLGMEPRKAVGTSAALGIPIALAAALGFIVAGLIQGVGEPHSLGFVNLWALMWMVPGVVVGAQLGAVIAHRIPAKWLMGLFCVFLAISAGKGLVSIFV